MNPSLAVAGLFAAALLSPLAALAQAEAPAPAPAPEPIAPLYRAQRHFENGAAFLTALPAGTKVTLNRLDGSAFTLVLENGKLKGTLPKPSLSEDGHTWTTPFGYRIFRNDTALQIDSPRGNWTRLIIVGKTFFASTKHGQSWSRKFGDSYVLRFTDGTRLDTTDEGKTFQVFSMGGERARLDFATGTWTALDPLPSPPVIPDLTAIYAAGNGDTWRRPGEEEHYAFAWNWYPYGFTPAQAVADVRSGFRRKDLDVYFIDIPLPQEPIEVAGLLLGRRLALNGGDRITLELPHQEPHTTFILPGALEPNYFELLMEVQLERPEFKSKGD